MPFDSRKGSDDARQRRKLNGDLEVQYFRGHRGGRRVINLTETPGIVRFVPDNQVTADGLNLRQLFCRFAERLAGVHCSGNSGGQTLSIERAKRSVENLDGTGPGTASRPSGGRAGRQALGRTAFWAGLRLCGERLCCAAGLIPTLSVSCVRSFAVAVECCRLKRRNLMSVRA